MSWGGGRKENGGNCDAFRIKSKFDFCFFSFWSGHTFVVRFEFVDWLIAACLMQCLIVYLCAYMPWVCVVVLKCVLFFYVDKLNIKARINVKNGYVCSICILVEFVWFLMASQLKRVVMNESFKVVIILFLYKLLKLKFPSNIFACMSLPN